MQASDLDIAGLAQSTFYIFGEKLGNYRSKKDGLKCLKKNRTGQYCPKSPKKCQKKNQISAFSKITEV